MDTILDLVDDFFSIWNNRKYKGEEVYFGDKSYSKSLGNYEVAKRLMLDTYPELNYVFNPTAAAYALTKGYDEKTIEKIEPLAEFNPFKIIETLTKLELVYNKDNQMLLKKDDYKLDEFYSNLYEKIMPEDALILLDMSLEKLMDAYNFLKDEGYIRLQDDYEAIKALFEDLDNDPIELVGDIKFSRYKKYGAFGKTWEKSVKKSTDVDKITELVCRELVRYNFWAKTPEEDFLDDKKINANRFQKRKKNEKIYKIMSGLRYFGITEFRERRKILEDNNIISFSAGHTAIDTPIIPNSIESSGEWKALYDDGILAKYIDKIAPKLIFPHLNSVFNEFFSKLGENIDTE